MASALQCPACGCKHRLSALSGEPVFACAQCGRLLKTPAEYLRPEPSGPAEAPRPRAGGRVQRGGSATRDRTSVLPAGGSAAGASAAGAGGAAVKPRRPGLRPQPKLALPVRIIAWIAAVGIGAYIVRWFAKTIGWLTGDSLIDVITGRGIGRYLRVFALVPFWALATALLATLFIEGGRWWVRKRSITPGRPAQPAPRRVPPAPKPAPVAKQPTVTPPSQPKPGPRQPAARQPAPQPVISEPRPAAPSPAAAETRSPTGAAGAPRPRRIPRRDVTP
jgi:hypothetical protein